MDRMMNRVVIVGALLVFFGLMMGGGDVLRAETPEQFYQGKTIHWIVVTEPGGSTDVIIRAMAPFLNKELGSSRIRIENRQGDEGFNYLYQQGARDGLTLAVKTGDAVIGNEIMKAPGVRYETDKFNFVADVFPSVKICQISPKLPFKTLDGLKKAKGLRAGATSTKGSLALGSAVLFELLGLHDSKVITGFESKKALILALARGEADIMVGTDNSAKKDEEDGYVINLLVLGNKRSNVVPHIPSLSELGVKIPKELAAAYGFVTAGGLAVALPPGVPPERVEYLRRAFQNIGSNGELKKAIEKLTGASRPFVSGKQVQEEMATIKRDKDLAATLDIIFKKYTVVR